MANGNRGAPGNPWWSFLWNFPDVIFLCWLSASFSLAVCFAAFHCPQEENPPEKFPPPPKKKIEQVFLNNFCWVPDSCYREAGRSSRGLFRKVRVNTFVFGYFWFWGASNCTLALWLRTSAPDPKATNNYSDSKIGQKQPLGAELNWRVPNPPGANPWWLKEPFPPVTIGVTQGLPGVPKKWQRILEGFPIGCWPTVTPDCEDLQGALSATRGLAPGGLGTRQLK